MSNKSEIDAGELFLLFVSDCVRRWRLWLSFYVSVYRELIATLLGR